MRKLAIALAAVAAIAGCKGSEGAPGQNGQNGQNGTSVGTIQGTVTASAGGAPVAGASVATLPTSSSVSTAAAGSYSIAGVPVGVYTVQVSATGFGTKTVANVSVVAGGTATVNVALDPPVVTSGSVTGKVLKRAATETPVAGSTVSLVDAEAFSAAPSEWPMETLAAASPYKATTAADGSYTVSGVAPGRYFVHADPATGDTSVFPGGARASIVVNAAQATGVTVTVSQRAPASASYVGSSTCLGCHGGTHGNWKRSLHALVYRKPGQPTANQDLTPYPNADKALGFFVNGNGLDNTGGGDEYGLRISRTDDATTWSAFPAGYNILLGRDASSVYFVEIESTDKTTRVRYPVDFTFGGHGIYKQRFVTRVTAAGVPQACTGAPATPCTDWQYFVLPLQYDENMQAGVQPFHPYNPTNWKSPAAGSAVAAAKTASFDLNCSGCHFTGPTVRKNATSALFQADAVNDPNGVIDYDADGVKDEMVIGCESCHGPGSAHASAPGRGSNIVQPRFLSAERENQVCTNCHTRGVGKGGFTGETAHTEYPSKGTDTLAFAFPGMSRSEFVADFHTDGLGTYSDDGKHSRQHHQQGNDALKSKHFKNPFDLVSCADCHDLHDRQNGPSLRTTATDNKLCLDCHAPFGFGLAAPWTKQAEALSVSAHMSSNAYMTAGYDPTNLANLGVGVAPGGVGRCTTCHMVKTAASQSRFVHEQVNAGLQPTGPRIRGDVSNHRFDVIWPAASESLQRDTDPAKTQKNLPNSCGGCHNSLVGAAPKYTY
jgi:predicted CXXCH cytochrome family protein